MHDLEHTLGTGQVFQHMLAEVEQLDPAVLDELLGRERHHDLTAVRGRHHPRRAVDRGAVVVAVAQLGRAGVDAHPHPQWPGHRPRLRSQRELAGDRGIDGVVRGRERGVEPVAGGLHHIAVVGLDRRPAAISS